MASSSVAKYGKHEHLEAIMRGKVRITPATTYRQTHLTAAQQDDELKKNTFLSPTTKVGIPVPGGGMSYVEPLGRITKTTEIRRTFYMASFTKCPADVAPRFVSEFNADARLVIQDPFVFGRRVCIAAARVRPKWTAFFAPCHYFDADVAHPDYLESDPTYMRDSLPWRLKDNRYAWQEEWRFIWLPDEELTGELSPIELAIGSIADIAVLERLIETEAPDPESGVLPGTRVR